MKAGKASCHHAWPLEFDSRTHRVKGQTSFSRANLWLLQGQPWHTHGHTHMHRKINEGKCNTFKENTLLSYWMDSLQNEMSWVQEASNASFKSRKYPPSNARDAGQWVESLKQSADPNADKHPDENVPCVLSTCLVTQRGQNRGLLSGI